MEQNIREQSPSVRIGESKLGAAWRDLVVGASLWRIWLALSWTEFIATYRRSYLGLIWVIVSFAAFVFVKLIIFSSLIDVADVKYYNAYLVVGIYVWMYLTTMMNSAPDTFVSVQGWIRSEPLPFSLYIYKSVMRELYNFVLMFVVVICAFVYIGMPVGKHSWMSALATAFLLINAFSIKLLLGLISARIRDVSHLVKATMLPLMFLTPIFWLPEQMPELMKYLWWNPFFHFIEIFRAPLISNEVPVESWVFTGVVFLLVSASGIALFARYRQRLVFWF